MYGNVNIIFHNTDTCMNINLQGSMINGLKNGQTSGICQNKLSNITVPI